ncbi:hypothetical protein AZI85_17030 [Bdellovibrio bacteriovorus]|uniref:Uncharacterized protein n=1 Tax=Bdellovibrio bacteriovorus TaxID=959 RepID=A0A150WTD7_BDEBC|nr:hypothetical protein [Bdellovibrio bacteriovorus]KYG67695.1 hypothetical protein AZI85_17030 [Bdellovibrio bacteriovorus]
MKKAFVLTILLTASLAQADSKLSPKKAQCLEAASEAIVQYLSDAASVTDYEILRNKKGQPEEITSATEQTSYVLTEIYKLDNGNELIVYGDESMFIHAEMAARGKTCQTVDISTAQNDQDWE